MIPEVIQHAYGFDASTRIEPLGAGHIHQTFLVTRGTAGFVLQRVNHHVFKRPDLIMQNIACASTWLRQHHPDYLFLSLVKSVQGEEMVYDEEGYPWRVFPYIPDTITLNEIQSAEEAYEAARGFARLTRNLDGCNTQEFASTIDRFHDLAWRYEQFTEALKNTDQARRTAAAQTIEQATQFAWLVNDYRRLVAQGKLPVRITHNDTKINNILFDRVSRKAVCVIDLDTLMPGYFIYDIGDMIRTFISPVSEEETDLSKVVFRREMYDALVVGYREEMNDRLSEDEKAAIPYGGMMMTYIMALRFLADYLNGDVYYSTHYPGQNLNRSRNQFRLLEILKSAL
jgi:Ser/Thr protein kinase RdoA (MazF antagonist)